MSYIKGIDISNNNGSIDFSKVYDDGVEIVYVKATEGATYKDSTMANFYTEAKAAGCKLGAYHFLVSTSTPEAQAQNFYSMIEDYEWDCIPMMDIETNFDGLCDYITRFITAFKELSSLTLGVYSYTSFIDYLTDAEETIKSMPFWEANYNDDPWSLSDNFFTNRIGHQYTESGSISGVSEGCDVDSFTDGVYLSSDGSSTTTTTVSGTWGVEDSKWKYTHADGTYTKDGWEKIDSKWYLFDSDGYMVCDWKKDGGNWYYLGKEDDGSMKTGWVYDENYNSWFYFNSDGVMQTGFVKVDSQWYYLNNKGEMCSGWIVVDGKDYLLDYSGVMYHDTTAYGYSFDSNGVATKIE